MAPWVTDLFWRSKRITYPHASLLGLPAELRQQILYEAMDMEKLDRTAIEAKEVRPDGQEIRDDELWNSSTRAQMTEAITSGRMLARLQLTTREGSLIAGLYRRIGELCCVSPVTRLDMVVVRTLWQRDLNRQLNSQYTVHLDTKLPTVAAGYEWVLNDEIKKATKAISRKRSRGKRIMTSDHRKLGPRHRPSKCWYCTERHPAGDPICPMARLDPENWEKMTKKVGGWRASADSRRRVLGKKVVFDDD